MLDSMSSLTVVDMPDAAKIIGGVATKVGPYGLCVYHNNPHHPPSHGWMRDMDDPNGVRKDGSVKRCDEK